MAFFPDSMYDFPNVSAYDSDLREVLAMLRGVTQKMKDFEVINKITNAGAWDITKQYKPWTIVSDNNIGYISVRPVPAGIEITNTDYWALVADYDILITNLSERISDLESHSVVIDGEILSLDRSRAALENMVHPFNKVILIGDSYMTRNEQRFATDLLNFLNISADNCVISAKGSTGFAQAADGKRFIDLLDDVSSAFTHSEVSHIIILGGANDSRCTSADIYSYMEAFIAHAKSEYPNAEICVGFVGATTAINDTPDYARAYHCYIETCWSSYIRYLNNVECVLHNSYYIESDQVHPTPYATTLLAYKCAEALIYGACHVVRKWTVSSTLWAAIEIEVCDGETKVYTKQRGGNKTFSPVIPTLTPLSIYQVDTITGLRIKFPTDYSACDSGATEVFYNNGNDANTIPSALVLSNDGIYIRPCCYGTYANVNLLTLSQFSISIPTIYT